MSDNEIIVLQAIKGLKSLASLAEFQAILLIDIGDDLFMALASVLAQRLSLFEHSALEIEVEIVSFLSHITESEEIQTDAHAVAAKRRAMQQGFVEHYLRRISSL